MRTIDEFVAGLTSKYPKIQSHDIEYGFTVGKKFYKVYTHITGKNKSVYCFVDKSNGDIYKAASWSAPANYVRGNINDEASVDNACTKYGITYLR